MIAALVEVSLGMAAAGGCVAVGRRATLPGVDPGQILAIRWRGEGEGEGERSASGARAAKALCAALARCRPRSAAPCRDGEDAPGGGLEGAARELVLRHFRLYTDQDDLLEEFRPLELQVRRVTVTAPTGREDFSAVAEFDLLPGGEAGRAYFSAAWGGRADADGWLRSCLMPMRIGLGTWDGRECYSVLSYRTQEAWSSAGPDQAA